jgi:hypothetical protein
MLAHVRQDFRRLWWVLEEGRLERRSVSGAGPRYQKKPVPYCEDRWICWKQTLMGILGMKKLSILSRQWASQTLEHMSAAEVCDPAGIEPQRHPDYVPFNPPLDPD